ncbi:GD25403 [Drosophila simulans]|uniref:GD25403 n=1 Tax=Drosophila simulans TaxID=7240 RepID=B4QCB6_DROSI|nr:GD25403 [Drosophila simulans]
MLIAIAKAAKRFYAKCLRFRLFHVQLLPFLPLLSQRINVPIRLILRWQQRKNLLLLLLAWAGPNYQDDQGVNKFIQSFIETNWLTDDDDDAMLPKRWSSGSEELDLVTWAGRATTPTTNIQQPADNDNNKEELADLFALPGSGEKLRQRLDRRSTSQDVLARPESTYG